MAWHGILGHDAVVEDFRRALRRGRLASSFLFVGPIGIGKRQFALKLAQSLLCVALPEAALDPCEVCPACLQVQALTHPDLQYVCKPEEKSFLPLELLIGDKEHRGREGLCREIAMKPFMGGRKVAIIDDADHLNPEGANCLLKTLEEPPPRSLLILLGTSPARQLPTIRSRCQLIRFRPLPADGLADLLLAQGVTADRDEALRLATASGGSVQRARELADPDLGKIRGLIFQHLAQAELDSVGLAAELLAYVDQSGRESSARRERLRQAIGLATSYFEVHLHRLSNWTPDRGTGTDSAPPVVASRLRGDLAAAARCLDRCLDASQQVDRNTHPTTLLECWLDDLARICGRANAAEIRR